MTVYALCYHYDSFGGDDTAVLGLYSTRKRLLKQDEREKRKHKNVGKKISLFHIVKSLRLMGFSFTATATTMKDYGS